MVYIDKLKKHGIKIVSKSPEGPIIGSTAVVIDGELVALYLPWVDKIPKVVTKLTSLKKLKISSSKELKIPSFDELIELTSVDLNLPESAIDSNHFNKNLLLEDMILNVKTINGVIDLRMFKRLHQLELSISNNENDYIEMIKSLRLTHLAIYDYSGIYQFDLSELRSIKSCYFYRSLMNEMVKLPKTIEKFISFHSTILEKRFLADLENLKDLRLSNCELVEIEIPNELLSLTYKHQNIVKIPSWISSMRKLRYLDLSKNNIEVINLNLRNLIELNTLLLNYNKIESLDYSLLPDSLKVLVISSNPISGKHIETNHLNPNLEIIV